MRDIAYYNGKIGRIDEVQAPITDRGFYFGDGVYDAAMVNNKKIFELEDHLDRFYNSLKLLRIEPPMQRDELTKTLNELVSQLDSDAPHMLYWQSTRAAAHRKHAFPAGAKATLMAFAEACPLDRHDHPYKLITVEDTRFLHCNIKTLNLIPSVIAYQRCIEQGCQETVFHRGERGHGLQQRRFRVLGKLPVSLHRGDEEFRLSPESRFQIGFFIKRHGVSPLRKAAYPRAAQATRRV